MINNVEVQEHILQTVMAKIGICARDACMQQGGNLLDLREYVRSIGNPWVNNHTVLPGKGEDTGISLYVMVPTAMPESGRFPLANALQMKLDADLPRCLKGLRDVGADDLGIVKLMRQLTEEYTNRQAILETVGSALPKAESRASSSSCARRPEAQASVASGSASGLGGPRAPMETRTPRPKRDAPMSKCQRVVAREARGRSRSRRSEPRARRVAAKRESSRPRRGNKPSGSVSALDKTYRKLREKMMALAAVFSSQAWGKGVRGKELLGKRLDELLVDLWRRCCAARREDIIEDLIDTKKTLGSFMCLIKKAKSEVPEEWDPIEMIPHLAKMADMLKSDGPDGVEQMLAPCFLKVQATLVAPRVKACGVLATSVGASWGRPLAMMSDSGGGGIGIECCIAAPNLTSGLATLPQPMPLKFGQRPLRPLVGLLGLSPLRHSNTLGQLPLES